MTINERLDELMPEISQGLIDNIEVKKRVLITQKLTPRRWGRVMRMSWTYLIADLYYRKHVSFNPITKPKFIIEMFDIPEHRAAYEIRKSIFLHKSRNSVLIEQWSGQIFYGKSKTRAAYREGRKNGIKP